MDAQTESNLRDNGKTEQSENLPYVTLLIPMRNEEGNIERCLDSVLSNDYPRDKTELLIIDGLSTDRSADIVRGYAEKYPWLRLISNPRQIQAVALNLGLREAKGQIILRMDAHSEYESDYISRCVSLLVSTDAVNVGGVQQAIGSDYLTRAIALATTSRLGIGDAKFRYACETMLVDTVYLGAWWKHSLEAVGGFDESLPVNEDYELNYRLRQAGGNILLSPNIASTYHVRRSLGSLARQYFRYE